MTVLWSLILVVKEEVEVSDDEADKMIEELDCWGDEHPFQDKLQRI